MHWLGEMCEELQEKLDSDLEMHNRKAKLLVFHATVHLVMRHHPSFSAQLLVVYLLAAFLGVPFARINNLDYG